MELQRPHVPVSDIGHAPPELTGDFLTSRGRKIAFIVFTLIIAAATFGILVSTVK